VSGGIGVCGALIGALATYWFTNRQARKASAAAEDERIEFQSFAVVLKLMSIYAANSAMVLRVKESMEIYEKGNFVSLSLAVSPYANTPERVRFSPDEVIRVGKFVGDEVLNVLMQIDSYHNTSMDLVDAYREQWSEVQRHIVPHSSEPSGVFNHIWTAKQEAMLRPKLNALDTLVDILRVSSDREAKNAYELIVAITQARLRKFKPNGAFEIENPEGNLVVISAYKVEVKKEV